MMTLEAEDWMGATVKIRYILRSASWTDKIDLGMQKPERSSCNENLPIPLIDLEAWISMQKEKRRKP